MLKNVNPLDCPVNSLIDSVLNYFLEVPIPENLDSLLDGFSSLSGCPCLFIDFKNRYVHSNSSKAITLLDSELTRSSSNLFDDILKIKSEREDESVELVYGKHARGVFVPVKVKEVI